MTLSAVLLFPPNWSACVSGPHLALPLLAGMVRGLDWHVETWDLSEEFYRTYAHLPPRSVVASACHRADWATLDQLYFAWEDQLGSLLSSVDGLSRFRLLSGYTFRSFEGLSLSEAELLTHGGTVYTPFYLDRVIPRLVRHAPSVVGVTIASTDQMVPALELLRLVRTALPNSFLILGGNIVTRLRESSAFRALTGLADQTVVYQGELAFRCVLESVSEVGVQATRDRLPPIASDESLPHGSWPVPVFNGIAFKESIAAPALSYVSTRGCYYGKCHFCAIPAGWSSKGYAGSAPAEFVARQITQMVHETGIPRVKLVDEALPPSKVVPLSRWLGDARLSVEWEAYARLEPAWEDGYMLQRAYAGGLRKLYFGLEQAPSASRAVFRKNDHGDPLRVLQACSRAGLKVHLFCMVGHPGTTREDAQATVRFLMANESLVDTADLVGFRLDRGTTVPGVRPARTGVSDWAMSIPYEPTERGVLSTQEVGELETTCQEELWVAVPRLLHPLYRVVGHWATGRLEGPAAHAPKASDRCSASSCSTPS